MDDEPESELQSHKKLTERGLILGHFNRPLTQSIKHRSNEKEKRAVKCRRGAEDEADAMRK